ncbi:MAG: nucleotide sugar dehydrogenase [Candidatus Thermoplasmatota archaeon]|nr:nucleotide sugar dehydrogenase [Candidatus Thermoplasmatota archaeon]
MVPTPSVKNNIICIIGLGYVGLPLAENFSQHFKVIGFDINDKKVQKLKQTIQGFEMTSDPSKIQLADVVIVAVPTPVLKSKQPDLQPVISASQIVGRHLKRGAIVVLESTVYPGVTEEVMAPILEKESGLVCGKDFTVGYSPERVNPGDQHHTIDKITKIVSGMDTASTEFLGALYGTITTVYKAQSIKIAEAAKVIENIQRDLNIALMNELSIIFHKMNLTTKDVLDAASTKWNFIRFSPGLVGGHCIPVDPYYLVYKANELGYHPQVILAGRAINDYMPKHVAELTIKNLNDAGKVLNGSKILLMGLTFKENVEDTRETPVREIISELHEFKCKVYGYDPLLTTEEIQSFGITPYEDFTCKVDAVIITVAHDHFTHMTLSEIKKFMNAKPVLIDIRGIFTKDEATKKGFSYATL